ncbi:MAG: hypothetical protein Q8J70_04050, partial [Thiobacillus sp.]|nr:hypothetical protein [Thiobacillus sp.]
MIANVQRQLAVVVAVSITAGCNNLPPVNPITTAVDPGVLTYARIQGRPDPVNLCSPASPPAPALPGQWWNSLPPAHLPKVAGHGVVGFDLWRNQTDSCRAFRQ